MTLFSLGVFDGSATWGMLARNLAWTLPGNLVGGGLLVGAVYTWLGGPDRRAEPATTVTPAAEAPEPGTPVPTPELQPAT